MSLYTIASLGGCGETLLIGNLILLVGIDLGNYLVDEARIGAWKWLLFGFLSGFGFWAFGLSLFYSLPVSAILVWSFIRQKRARELSLPAGLTLLGAMIGALPWWNTLFSMVFPV